MYQQNCKSSKKGSLTHAAFTTTKKTFFLEKSIFFLTLFFSAPKLHNKRFLIIDPRESFFDKGKRAISWLKRFRVKYYFLFLLFLDKTTIYFA
jgi:hypothetical protein